MDKETLNGFEVFDDFMPGANVSKTNIESIEDEDNKLDIDDATGEMTDEELEQVRGKKTEKVDDTDDQNVEEDDEIEDVKPVKKEKSTSKKKEEKEEDDINDDDIDDNDTTSNESEEQVVVGFFDSLSEEFGWDDIEEDEKPKNVEELVDYFKSVIEENSVPQYASEEVEALDNFVKNGGNIKDYFQIDGELDLENINIEDDETNQKLVLKEFLKEKGFNASQIEKKLHKYSDAGLLEDEASDALEALKDIRETKKQQLLEAQEKKAKEYEKRNQDFFNSVVSEIKGMKDVRGIKIPEKDKKELLEYIFKPCADGKTKFQKDWQKDVKNLLESAYFTMKGDTLLKVAKSEGSNAAISKFKDSLSKTGVSRKTKKQDNTSTQSVWDSFARRLRVN